MLTYLLQRLLLRRVTSNPLIKRIQLRVPNDGLSAIESGQLPLADVYHAPQIGVVTRFGASGEHITWFSAAEFWGAALLGRFSR